MCKANSAQSFLLKKCNLARGRTPPNYTPLHSQDTIERSAWIDFHFSGELIAFYGLLRARGLISLCARGVTARVHAGNGGQRRGRLSAERRRRRGAAGLRLTPTLRCSRASGEFSARIVLHQRRRNLRISPGDAEPIRFMLCVCARSDSDREEIEMQQRTLFLLDSSAMMQLRAKLMFDSADRQ